jgi:flagellar basal-body rod protein FlgB
MTAMDFTKLPLFERLSERMGWLNARQDVLSQNVANADTPSYTPKDLKAQSFGDQLQKLAAVQPELTSPMHLQGTIPVEKGPGSEKTKTQYESSPSGNSVILEEQMMKVQQTQMNYQLITSLYRKHVDIMKRAIGQ